MIIACIYHFIIPIDFIEIVKGAILIMGKDKRTFRD